MKLASSEELRGLAAKNGWSRDFAEGYVDGKAARQRGTQSPKFPLGNLEEYRQGFLAGYSLVRERRCRGGH
ncbi:MAG: hypothetical protein WBO23_17550 [Burkholderiales bacterium]